MAQQMLSLHAVRLVVEERQSNTIVVDSSLYDSELWQPDPMRAC
jgi:hypothetical protein